MKESDERAYKHHEFISLIHGIESNIENLRALRDAPVSYHDQEENLVMVIKAQKQSLKKAHQLLTSETSKA
jgi:hypothetical protein